MNYDLILLLDKNKMTIPFRIHNFDNPTTNGNVEESNTISTEYNSFQSFFLLRNLVNNISPNFFLPFGHPQILPVSANIRQNLDNSLPTELVLSHSMTSTVSEPLLSLPEILTDLLINIETSQLLSRNEEVEIDICSQKFSTTGQKDKTCSICTEEFEDDDFVSVLDCLHTFHTKCIKEWSFYKQNCPLCRMKIPTLTR
jgi:hypothetical protein